MSPLAQVTVFVDESIFVALVLTWQLREPSGASLYYAALALLGLVDGKRTHEAGLI